MPETPEPTDFGEPWTIRKAAGDRTWEDMLDRHGNEIYLHDGAPRHRIVECVNFLRGCREPEKAIRVTRDVLETCRRYFELTRAGKFNPADADHALLIANVAAALALLGKGE